MSVVALIITIIAAASLVVNCYAENVYFGVSVGASYNIKDDEDFWKHHWKDQYNIRAKLYYRITPRLMIGGEGVYNNWTPTAREIIGAHWDIREPAKIYEAYSSLRMYVLEDEDLPLDVFIQGGFGIAVIDDAEVYTYPIIPNPPPPERMDVLGNRTRAGLLFAGGLTLKVSKIFSIELIPSYSIIFHEVGDDKTLHFYSISIGMLYKI